jgi:hypothetical protein
MTTTSEFFSICVMKAASPIAACMFGVGGSPRDRAFHGSKGFRRRPIRRRRSRAAPIVGFVLAARHFQEHVDRPVVVLVEDVRLDWRTRSCSGCSKPTVEITLSCG